MSDCRSVDDLDAGSQGFPFFVEAATRAPARSGLRALLRTLRDAINLAAVSSGWAPAS